MDSTRAKEFGVIDKVSAFIHCLSSSSSLVCFQTCIADQTNVETHCSQILWRGQEKVMADVAAPGEWDKGAGIKVVDGF